MNSRETAKNQESELPLTYETSVTTSNRVIVPIWANFINPGDTVIGEVNILGIDETYPFEKKVSSSRYYTIGHIKKFLPQRKFPPRVVLTITRVIKAEPETVSDINIYAFSKNEEEQTFSFAFSPISETLRFYINEINEGIFVNFYANSNTFSRITVNSTYKKEEDIWLLTYTLPLDPELGGIIPGIITIIVDSAQYNLYLNHQEKVLILIKRFSNWLCDINDFNKDNLTILAKSFIKIIAKGEEPEYSGVGQLLALSQIEREILLFALQSHHEKGIPKQELYSYLSYEQEEIDDVLKELVEDHVLRIYKHNNKEYVDTLWYF